MANLTNFLVSFIASLIAVFLALWVERSRMPALTITVSERANTNAGYPEMREWRFVRALVVNQPMPWPFRWIPRYTAENCHARIEFLTLDSRPLLRFSERMNGFPDEPERPLLPKRSIMVLGRDTSLGAMQGRWTNTPEIPLGDYRVRIAVTTQNGTIATTSFHLHITQYDLTFPLILSHGRKMPLTCRRLYSIHKQG
ncbi:MAG: hypothetical protein HY594_05120 [Candidatus Omnitrophica bacterium]|nr:hypothetical protein [Candidatus Omnitrophota bacterium]